MPWHAAGNRVNRKSYFLASHFQFVKQLLDLILGLGFLIVYLAIQLSMKIRPAFFGKWATIFNMSAVIWTLIGLKGAYFLYYPGSICVIISGIQYICDGFRQVNESGKNHVAAKESE